MKLNDVLRTLNGSGFLTKLFIKRWSHCTYYALADVMDNAAMGSLQTESTILFKKKYREHNERVKVVIPEERLLVFNVKQVSRLWNSRRRLSLVECRTKWQLARTGSTETRICPHSAQGSLFSSRPVLLGLLCKSCWSNHWSLSVVNLSKFLLFCSGVCLLLQSCSENFKYVILLTRSSGVLNYLSHTKKLIWKCATKTVYYNLPLF